MPSPIVTTSIQKGPLPTVYSGPGGERTDFGAELIFHGVVRDEEGGRPVTALYYEPYPGMAERELEALALETAGKFDLLELHCIHLIGEVPIGEASLRVAMKARHRAAALEAMAWFIGELKQRVPIWKWGVAKDGSRFPSSGPGKQS